jgi:AcrR family transcriptional regulator
MATSRPEPRARERDLVQAARALFDERGMQEAPIEEIARTAGIARGLIYRSFSSKEELFVLTVTTYLDELDALLGEAIPEDADPRVQLERCTDAYVRYCHRFPAFLDCSLSLMRRPAPDLQAIVSDSVWLRLGQHMARCIDRVAAILRSGNERGTWVLPHPDYTANLLWTQGLGVMHLARLGVGVRRVGPGVPDVFTVPAEDVVASCVQTALAVVGIHPSPALARPA